MKFSNMSKLSWSNNCVFDISSIALTKLISRKLYCSFSIRFRSSSRSLNLRSCSNFASRCSCSSLSFNTAAASSAIFSFLFCFYSGFTCHSFFFGFFRILETIVRIGIGGIGRRFQRRCRSEVVGQVFCHGPPTSKTVGVVVGEARIVAGVGKVEVGGYVRQGRNWGGEMIIEFIVVGVVTHYFWGVFCKWEPKRRKWLKNDCKKMKPRAQHQNDHVPVFIRAVFAKRGWRSGVVSF